ncbi:hypothetical protein SAMN02910369_00407 [Lachnospiraceae bacterium NE2001]|nr:hypothetical protein SAMN02910369_00407 [Lachnospiraceae bacterium NE2001]
MAKYCRQCGCQLNETSSFCPRCGTQITYQSRTAIVNPANQQASNVNPANQQSFNLDQARQQISSVNPINQKISNWIGDMAMDLPANPVSSVVEKTGGVSIVKSILNSYKNPKTIIIALIIPTIWIMVDLMERNDVGGIFAKLMSILTYAEGGRKGNLGQLFGGTLGKIFAMAGFSSIVNGGLIQGARGIGSVFKKGRANFGAILIGAGLGAACCIFFISGKGVYGVMVGLLGIIVSFKSMVNENGLLSMLISKITGKLRSSTLYPASTENPIYRGIFTGLSIGFTIGAALVTIFTEVHWASYLIALLIINIGVIITILTSGKDGGRL